MLTFLCPYCDTENSAQARPIGSLPPTGGDYEWQEGDKMHTCHHCKNTFEIRVRTSIETGTLLFINKTPKPKNTDILWYAVATIEKSFWATDPNEKSIYVSAVCQTKEMAKAILLKHSQKHYQPLHLLSLNSIGYFDEQGNQIKESSTYADVINYLEIRDLY